MEKKMLIDFLTNGTVTIPALLLQHYADLGLNEQETMILIHLNHFLQAGNRFPTPEQLSARMTLSQAECTSLLRRLLQLGFLKINHDASSHVYSEQYSLDSLWERLISHTMLQMKGETQRLEEENLYTIFEKEFGRPLSPIECETLAMWMDQDHHTPNLIVGALREAVISGKLNFRYIDRILFDWQRNGIKTLEEAKIHSERIRGQQKRPASLSKDQGKVTPLKMYNWLENE
ncbi:MAG TPA: DnaD domain-containing protein [Sporolactobacillaceae bacterium]|nr:DnaD domain-containing protein [Sporolactobacillaceae bacterium]